MPQVDQEELRNIGVDSDICKGLGSDNHQGKRMIMLLTDRDRRANMKEEMPKMFKLSLFSLLPGFLQT